MTGRQTSRQATRQRTRKPSSQRGQVRGRLGNRNRKRNRRHGPINALKRSWRKANWPTRIKMVLIPTVAVVVVVALVAGLVRFTNWRAQVRAAEAAQLELTRTYDFNPGNIISDGQFFNGSAMSQAEVQSFLDTQGGSLAAMTFDTSNESGEGLCTDYTGGNHRPVGPRLQGEPESAAHRDAEGAASGHCRRSQRLSAYGGDGVELSGYRRLRSRLCRILSAGVWRGQAVPLLSRARGTVRVYGAQSQLHPISSERGMRRRTSVYREQGDRSTSIRPTSRTSPHWPLATVPAIPAPVMATATSRLSTPAGSVRREADNGS